MKEKRLRFYQRWIDHNSHNNRNILRTKSGKCKTTKGIHGHDGYHEASWWHLWRSISERLCSLQKMDQRVIQQQNFMAPKGNKIYTTLNADPF